MKIMLVILLWGNILIAQDIVFGIVPQQSPLKLAKKWLQITDYLSKQTGANVIFKTENSIPAFQKKLYAGAYDMAYMNPYHFIVAKRSQGYSAKIRAKKSIKGIVVSKDKVIDGKNLAGKTFLFPAPDAFAATLVIKYEFKKKFDFDIDQEATVLYVNSHDSVYKGISRNIGAYGGGIVRTFTNFNDLEAKNDLHIVYTTNEYPSHPIAFHPKVDPDTIHALENAFLSMPVELKNLLSIQEFIPTTSAEYSVIEKFDE